MSNHSSSLSFLALALLSALAAPLITCGGRPNTTDPDGGLGTGTVSGAVIKGRVGAATVSVYRFEGGTRGAKVGSATTAADGTFSVDVGISQGPFILVATRGAFVDEASGASIELNTEELTLIVPSFATGHQLGGLLVTPISHLATALALFYMRTEALPLDAAVDDAFSSLNGHFAGVDWQSVVPRDLTTAQGIQLDDATKAGLVLAGLSQLALNVSRDTGLSPGGAVNPLSLTKTLYADLENDGFFDGVTPGGPLYLPPAGAVNAPYGLDGATVRFTLATAISNWLNNPRYTYGVRIKDVQALLHAISINSNARIFRTTGNAFDQQPPSLSFTTPLDRYAKASLVYVEVAATDATGVDKVHFDLNGNRFEAVKQSNGNYGAILNLKTGDNDFAAWGQDTIGNSGEAASAPHRLSFRSTLDTTPPSIQHVISSTEGGFYQSEQNLGIASSNGEPAMPVQFTGIGVKETIGAGSTIYKSVARLDWAGVAPSADELFSTNASNTPWLRFRVQYNINADAPLTSATYSIACEGCPPATGDLLSFEYVNGYQHYALPINAVTVPALGRAQASPLALSIRVTVKDAAGNESTTDAHSLTIHLVGPPVAFREDANYWQSTSPDPQSVYYYRVNYAGGADKRYDSLFSANNPNFQNDPAVPARAIRVLVKNPFPFPVVVNLTPQDSATWAFTEDWDDDSVTAPTATFTHDGITYDRDYDWAHGNYRLYCRGTNPCADYETAIHTLGDTTPGFFCIPDTEPPPTVTNPFDITNSAWTTRGYLSPQLAYNEPPSSAAPGGYQLLSQPAWRVPAASGTTPGEAVVYIVVPRARPGSPPLVPPLVHQALPGRTARLQYHYRDYWAINGQGANSCVDGETGTRYYSTIFTAQFWYRFLATSAFKQNASWQVNTRATFNDGTSFTAFGAPAVAGASATSINVDLTSP